MSRVRNDADLVLSVRQDKRSRVRNDADLLLKVRQNRKSRVKDKHPVPNRHFYPQADLESGQLTA